MVSRDTSPPWCPQRNCFYVDANPSTDTLSSSIKLDGRTPPVRGRLVELKSLVVFRYIWPPLYPLDDDQCACGKIVGQTRGWVARLGRLN
jgi:hypothetical protein